MSECADYGTAIVQTTPEGPRWMHADDHIHITDELLANPEARAFIEARYELGDACPEQRNVVHAHAKAEATS